MGLFDFNKRPKSAINRDRAYKSNEPHERAYKRKNKPKNPRYSKYEGGGNLSDFSGNYYSTNDFVGSNNLEELANRTFGENWEAEDDVYQIEQLVGEEYVVLVPPDRSEWNDMMQQYGDYLKSKTGDSNYDIFVINKQDYYDLQDDFMSRTEDENYEAGGKVKKKYKYIPNYMLREAEVENKGKTTYIDGKDILDGIYVKAGTKYEEGGETYGTSPSGVRSLKSQLPYKSWISMSKLSRKNFLREIGYTNEEAIERISNINNFSDIPAEDKNYIEYNSDMFIYRGGGKVKKKKIKNYKYVPNRMIEAVEVENNGKTTEIDGANILDGIYVKGNVKFEAGGSTYSGWTIGQDLSRLPNKYYFLYNEYTGERKGYFSTMKEAKKEMVRLGYYESGGGVGNYETGMKVSTETLESMVGRKLNGWNDDKVYHSGMLYVKCYLKPEYKVYAL